MPGDDRVARGDSSHISLLALVREVAADAASPSDPDDCLRRLRRGLIRLGFSRAGIWVTVESDPSVLHGTWGTSWDGSEIDEHELSGSVRHFVGAAAILRGDHVALNRVEPQGNDIEALQLPLVEAQGLPNRACVPLRADGQLIAIISVDMLPTHKTIDPEQVAALEVVADHVAAAIARGRIMSSLRAELVERRLVEESLRVSEERQRSLFDGLPIGLYRTSPDGDVVDANPALVDLLGYTNPEQVKALDLRQTYVNPDDRTRFKAIVERDGIVQGLEMQLRRHDGSVIWVEDTGRLVRNPDGTVRFYEGSLRDITRRKQAESALRDSEERLRFVVEHTGDAIYRLRFDTMKYDYISPSIETLTGYTAEEIQQIDWNAIIEERTTIQGAAITDEYLQSLQSPETVGPFHADYLIHTKSGEQRWLEDRSEPWRDRDGTLLGSVGILSDITERKLLEETLRQAQKMQAIGRLAGGIAHDFNNLLTVINGYADLLQEQSPSNTFAREAADQILNAGENAAKLTGHLLAFSRQQILTSQLLDLNVLLERITQIVQRTIGEDVTFAAVLSPEIGLILADPGQIEQIVMNLVSNAREAMPRGGKLTIQTLPANLDQSYARLHPDAKVGPYVMLAVGDTGRGMDAETRRRVFEPFYTTKDERLVGKGAGLGLAAVYGMVKQCGGAIDVYSELGLGTTFKVYFPRIDSPATAPADADGQKVQPYGTETIMVIEDEDPVRQVARLFLENRGYTVIEADGGEQALQVTASRGEPIHLLLTDVVMPGLNGPEIASQLLERFPNLKVVYMSGFTDDMVFRHGVISEGVNFLQKPFTPASLTQKIREILDG